MTVTRSRRVLRASGIAAVLGLTACSAGRSPLAGGGPPRPLAVTLTLGVPDSPGFPPEFQDIAYFARQVRQISGGTMKIRILWEVTQVTNSEPATVSLVRDGKVDLGWVGARAFYTAAPFQQRK